MTKRTRLVVVTLALAWAVLLIWQYVEHDRVRQAAKVALINRSKDISTTLGVVMRAQRRFGVIPTDRIESYLNALIKPGELDAVALLNAAGEVVASAGSAIDFDTRNFVRTGEHWGERFVALMNLVDLGTNVTAEADGQRPTIIVRPPEIFNPFGTNRPPPDRPPPPDRAERPERSGPDHPGWEPPPRPEMTGDTNAAEDGEPPRWRGRGRRGDGRPPFGRPFWMTEEEYAEAIEKQGVHSFVVLLATAPMRAATNRDLWLRFIISVLGTVSVVGSALAWRNLTHSSDLEVRLVRAAELNTRLKEMNLAAAGLAHETKNPLNIIRGMAQMISKQAAASPAIRQQSRSIVDEADRVTAQLNDFINFSRPREVRRAPVALNAVISEVVRALRYDLEENAIQLHVPDALPAIEADEQLLRQALFNLLLNAVQAVPRAGEIRIVAEKSEANQVTLDIRDNGPGVSAELRADIFKPYFTTQPQGTGLGLAVVQQIVLAHGWEITCLPNDPHGAIFRLAHLRPAANA